MVWDRFRALRDSSTLGDYCREWPEHLTGLMEGPADIPKCRAVQWSAAADTIIDANTPWDLLRSNLLWSLWCQRCNFELGHKPFHAGAALFNAWRATILSGIEALADIYRHHRTPKVCADKQLIFQKIWTKDAIFAKMDADRMVWTFVPPASLLPQGMASVYGDITG